jgi:hypothetical protein
MQVLLLFFLLPAAPGQGPGHCAPRLKQALRNSLTLFAQTVLALTCFHLAVLDWQMSKKQQQLQLQGPSRRCKGLFR